MEIVFIRQPKADFFTETIFYFNFDKLLGWFVGGERRICPKNAHQAPDIVVLVGSKLDGFHAVAAARHLANHTVSSYIIIRFQFHYSYL